MTSLSPSVPLALRQIQEGLADINHALNETTDPDECLQLRIVLKPLVDVALAIQLRTTRRADELMEGK